MRTKILFSLRDGDLTLQARRPEDPRLFQLVPRAVFVDDFPKAFVDDCVHWLDLGTGEVEFRPVESPWTPDPCNWRLTVGVDGSRSVFRKISGDCAAPVNLIDIRSGTFQIISRLFSALEFPEYMIITHINQALEVSLSRLHLVFFVNQDSELECRSMPGYVIDEFQSCGTMFGLKNQLVLRPGNGSLEMPRRVIIPQGDIEFSLDGDFASASVNTGTARHVHWHEYIIDTDLGRLTGDVSLRSKLYQCYLHALTSHCLPDPLLGHTGTEESLNMLQSATFLSFQRLGKNEAKLLDLIRNLTPIREYYPSHLKSMVTVEWNNLPILSQHHHFHHSVLSILDHAHMMEALHDKPVVFEVPHQEASLLTRAASRNKVYYPNDLQSLRHSPSSISEDVVYKSRDVADGGIAELSACETSSSIWSIWNGQPHLSQKWYNLKLWDTMQSWGSLGTSETTISLRYSRYWLTFDAAKDWLSIYDICQEALNYDPRDSTIRLAFSLSAASFCMIKCKTNYADVIPFILIFATDTRFRGLVRPPPSYYDLSDGTCPDYARLSNLMCRFALPLEQTPVQAIVPRVSVINENLLKQAYNESIIKLASDGAQTTLGRWPQKWCDLPPEWFDTQRCRKSVEAYLGSVSQNINFRDHIYRLEIILNGYEASISPRAPYVFSPQFSARPPKASPPSLREVLMSRANFPLPPTCELHSSGGDILYVIQDFP